ncbi:hypothetical protein [Collinsella intestinalis]|uniref:hypothetical protein n=1 Tax=Collinsella intestinalis TaxID=147207 RepID=UPI0019575B18|nr:hypothetical protein [Collinsella intestinalis]MBM6908823.1 hypothetical protein [Collinsella intestinalis]MDM8163142.1 hypothetical protein [Collinsella intestinalis]
MYMTPQACADAGAAYPDYELFIGFDVGKSFHVAHARDRAGRRVGPGRVDNVEDAACALPSPAIGAAGADPSRTLVVDQRRNIGTTVVRRARAAGCEVACLTGKREKKARELSRAWPGTTRGTPRSSRPRRRACPRKTSGNAMLGHD